MHYKPSQTPSNNQNECPQAAPTQPNHRTLKHAFYAAGASAALSLLVMTGCSCSSNQDALETIPNTGSNTTVNTTVQANPESQAANQTDSQDVTKYSATAQNSAQGPTIEEVQAEADARVQAAEAAQKQAEDAEAQLQAELEASQKAQAEAEASAQTARDEKDALQKELETAQQSQAAAETDAQALFDEKEATVADANALVADNEKLTIELQTAQAAQAKAEEDTKTAQEAQKKAETDLAQTQEELKSTIAAKDAALAEADQAKQENASLADANAAAEEARVKAEEEASAAKAAQAEAEAKVEAGLLSAADVEAAQAAQAKAESEAQAAKDAQAAAESENQKLKEENSALEAELEELKAGATNPEGPDEPTSGDKPGSEDTTTPGDDPTATPDDPANDNLLDATIPGAHNALRPSRFDADNYYAYGMAVRPSLEAYSWNEIAHIASFIEARALSREEALELAKTFNLINSDGTFTGDTKAITLTDGQTIDVLLVDVFHDYTELDEPTAFTFMLAENYTNQAMNESGTNEGGWELSDMRYWLNDEVVEKLPDSLYYSIKPVQKFTNNVGNTDNPENVYATTDLLFLFSWAECLGPLSWNEGTDLAYIDAVNNAEGYQYAWFTQQGVAGDQNNPALIRSERVALPVTTTPEDALADESEEVPTAPESTNNDETPATGQDSTWWMRSSDPSSTTNFGDMGPEIENGSVASTPEGVVFGFCL